MTMRLVWGLLVGMGLFHCASTGGAAKDGGALNTGGGSGGGTVSATGGGPAGTCPAAAFLQSLGKSTLLAGASFEDDVASSAPWDIRYLYLSGGYPTGSGPCSSCASGCAVEGASCANSGGGCSWWGCWQYDQEPPGAYVRDFIAKAKAAGQLPMVTYYTFLQASGVAEGASQVAMANNAAFMTRYFNDWRFVLQQVGTERVLLHLEPDFWGYAQQRNPNPHLLPAQVTVNATDCGAFENSVAGFGRCLIAMTRKYAPNAKVALQASAWATSLDVSVNTNPSLDVAGEARKVGSYLVECGAALGDYLAVEASDRDAAFYQQNGRATWWDATNATLPHFRQHFVWAKALAETVGKALVWWQVPVGHMGLGNTPGKWRDNRVDYFFAHPGEIAAAHGAAMAFGAGADGQTSPSTDDNNLINKVKAYRKAGGQAPCP